MLGGGIGGRGERVRGRGREESENEGEEDQQEKEEKENRWGKQRSSELAWKPVEAAAAEGWSFMFHFVEKRGLGWRQS